MELELPADVQNFVDNYITGPHQEKKVDDDEKIKKYCQGGIPNAICESGAIQLMKRIRDFAVDESTEQYEMKMQAKRWKRLKHLTKFHYPNGYSVIDRKILRFTTFKLKILETIALKGKKRIKKEIEGKGGHLTAKQFVETVVDLEDQRFTEFELSQFVTLITSTCLLRDKTFSFPLKPWQFQSTREFHSPNLEFQVDTAYEECRHDYE